MSSVLDDIMSDNNTADSPVAVTSPSIKLQEEMKAYRSLNAISLQSDPLQWWKMNALNFPYLSRYARIFLAIPGSSTPSERVFSTAGNVIRPERACLTPDNVDILVFLKHNMKL